MPVRSWLSIIVASLVAAGSAIGAEPAPRQSVPVLVDTIGTRHGLPLTGTWDIAVPEKVMRTDDVDVAVTLYALRDATGIRALVLAQRNVLPEPSGWGPPTRCADGKAPIHLTVYQSPRDVLCGWAQPVSFTAPGTGVHVGTIADAVHGVAEFMATARPEGWVLMGLRVSNRHDFLDLQLLIAAQPDVSAQVTQPFLADLAHSLDATWLTGAPAVVPPPPPPKPVPVEAGGWFSGTLSTSAMRTATYRVGVSIKTFAVASLMAGDAATGGAIIGVLNFTSTGLYLANDYIWETWSPLTPAPQDFIHLVDAP